MHFLYVCYCYVLYFYVLFKFFIVFFFFFFFQAEDGIRDKLVTGVQTCALPIFLNRTTERVRCTFMFDGVVLEDVGVRQAGGTFNRFVPIEGKPTLSLKFDDFVDGQELHGLEKMVLKDGRQDTGLVSEHLTYEVYRRAGIAAPMTAHAHVTINGIDSGIYVMREPINKDFLTRNFGKEFNDGNIYELNYQPDPMIGP